MNTFRRPARAPLLLAGVILIAGCSKRAAIHSADAAPKSMTAEVQFTDVTKESGIDFTHQNGAAGGFLYPETFGAGCAFIDLDGDRLLDVVLVNSAGRPTLAFYRNKGNGRFVNVTQTAGVDLSFYGMGVAVGDYDNDGRDDLYVTGLDRSILLRNEWPAVENRASGLGSPAESAAGHPTGLKTAPPTFRDVTKETGVGNEGRWGTSAAWLDFDNDGFLDLFVCNYIRYAREQEQVCRQGGERIYCGPLVYSADSCRLYKNLNGRRFRDVTLEAGIEKSTGKSLGVAVWDIDGDRYPEVLVANDLTPNYLFRNFRGRFTETALESGIAYGGDGLARSGMGIDVADTRHDGRCAVFISNFAREPNSLFEQEESHHFSDRSYESGMGEASLQSLGFGLFFFDFDNDGWKDAFVTNGHIQPSVAKFEPSQKFAQRPLLFRNRGDGTFDDVTARSGNGLNVEEVGRGAACGDFDNDGDQDILISTNNGPARLLRNDRGSTQNWLTIRLQGSRSNRSGIGAQVTVTMAGVTLRDQVRSGSSYLSASDLRRLHFGLAQARQADLVEVRWPGGTVDRLLNVEANQHLTIREGRASR